jgi:hypothetical protein
MLRLMRTLLVLSLASSVAPVSAERLGEPLANDSGCPFERARLAATQAGSSDAGPAEGSLLGVGRSAFLAP